MSSVLESRRHELLLNLAETNGTGNDPGADYQLTGEASIYIYFLSLALVILLHRWTGALFNRVGIPRIIGDIVSGVLLGPTIMGTSANLWLFPRENRPMLNAFGQWGLIMTSMSAGFAFDHRILTAPGRAVKIVGYTVLNVAIPTLIAVPLFYILPANDDWRGPSYSNGAFFVLLAGAMSSSALPMVFLILDEMKVQNEMSRYAIGLSCLSTVALFTLLSVVSVLSDSSLSNSVIALRLLFLVLVVVFLWLLQTVWHRCLAHKLTDGSTGLTARFARYLRYGSDDMSLLVIALGLLSAVASERLGYTVVQGAFLAGAAMPFDLGLRSNLAEKVRWATRWIFLPQFFVVAGLSFDLRQLSANSIPYVLLFLVFAFACKALLVPASRLFLRLNWQDACFCAAFANCRGFNSIILAQVALQYELVGASFYIACVLLAIFSTAVTGPMARPFKRENDGGTFGGTAAPTARTALASNLRSPATGVSSKDAGPLSPRLLDQPRGSIDEGKSSGEADSDAVHIVLPSDSAGAGGGRRPSPDLTLQERETMFASWLSDSHDERRSKVLIVFADEITARLRDPNSILHLDTSAGESRFRGDLLCDALCKWYKLSDRGVAVQLGQKLLEAGLIQPIEAPVFIDNPTLYSLL